MRDVICKNSYPMLYMIGTGLCKRDISVYALEVVRSCDKVYLEEYTSRSSTLEGLSKFYGVRIEAASRRVLEETDAILLEAVNFEVVLLIAGSPLFATTHADILIRAKRLGIAAKVIHNSSILNAIGSCGLYSYAFGRTVSIPFFQQSWRPTSFYENIHVNMKAGLHTLCLLDICVDESQEMYMSANVAIRQLFECEEIKGLRIINNEVEAFVICRFGHSDEKIVFDKLGNLRYSDFGSPLHSLVIPASMDIIEREHVGILFG